MAKNEKDKQTTAHTTQHRKLKNKQHEPHQKNKGWSQVLRKGKQILLHMRHPSTRFSEYIYNHWVLGTACGTFIPDSTISPMKVRCVDIIYHCNGQNNKLAIY